MFRQNIIRKPILNQFRLFPSNTNKFLQQQIQPTNQRNYHNVVLSSTPIISKPHRQFNTILNQSFTKHPVQFQHTTRLSLIPFQPRRFKTYKSISKIEPTPKTNPLLVEPITPKIEPEILSAEITETTTQQPPTNPTTITPPSLPKTRDTSWDNTILRGTLGTIPMLILSGVIIMGAIKLHGARLFQQIIASPELFNQYIERNNLRQRFPKAWNLTSYGEAYAGDITSVESVGLKNLIIYSQLIQQIPQLQLKCNELRTQLKLIEMNDTTNDCNDYFQLKELLTAFESELNIHHSYIHIRYPVSFGSLLHWLAHSENRSDRPLLITRFWEYFGRDILLPDVTQELNAAIMQFKLTIKNINNLSIIIHSLSNTTWRTLFRQQIALHSSNNDNTTLEDNTQDDVANPQQQLEQGQNDATSTPSSITQQDVSTTITYPQITLTHVLNLYNYFSIGYEQGDISKYCENPKISNIITPPVNFRSGITPIISHTRRTLKASTDSLSKYRIRSSTLQPEEIQLIQQAITPINDENNTSNQNLIDLSLLPTEILSTDDISQLLTSKEFIFSNTLFQSKHFRAQLVPCVWTYVGPFSIPTNSIEQIQHQIDQSQSRENNKDSSSPNSMKPTQNLIYRNYMVRLQQFNVINSNALQRHQPSIPNSHDQKKSNKSHQNHQSEQPEQPEQQEQQQPSEHVQLQNQDQVEQRTN